MSPEVVTDLALAIALLATVVTLLLLLLAVLHWAEQRVTRGGVDFLDPTPPPLDRVRPELDSPDGPQEGAAQP